MAAEISRWSRRYVLIGVIALCCWQVATVAGLPRRTTVALGVFGFVFHVVFGKSYALVPAYFDADLVFEHAPMVQLPFIVMGGLRVSRSTPLLARRFPCRPRRSRRCALDGRRRRVRRIDRTDDRRTTPTRDDWNRGSQRRSTAARPIHESLRPDRSPVSPSPVATRPSPDRSANSRR